MEYSVLIEKINDGSLPDGYYYAHIPALDLTTHGMGIQGAKTAAEDLIYIWIEEKLAHAEPIPIESDSYYSKIEVKNALQSA
ncbi:MAG: type II toxin-antitoxin system HicB family antitoxin [Spirochaetaceae bacterium]|nr:MAG: type II toxin-antitoxin system HicB family antitoxin [Spirochaetaceae bacterium]